VAETRLARIDWPLLGGVLLLVGLGLPYLHSASPAAFQRQVLWIALGLAAMAVAFRIDYRTLLRYAYEIYGLAFLLLVVVLAMPPVHGARSWLRVPGVPFSLQPVELFKLALVLALARHLMHRETQATWRGLIIPFCLTLAPMALILRQPDLGSALLIPPVLFAVLFASGARVAHLGAVLAGGLLSAVPMWFLALKDYQRRRIHAFLDPERYETREAYQLIRSLIAIGTGGVWGEGLGRGTLNSLNLLPESHNDFIFGVIAEEGGFVRAGLLALVYLLVVLLGFRIAYRTREPGGRLIAVGCSTVLGAQALINMGVVTAMLPTTGIPLPFVSYGGSSLLVSFALVGLLLNVGATRPLVTAPDTFTGRGRVR
jgi:rod shape-determining protein RodA